LDAHWELEPRSWSRWRLEAGTGCKSVGWLRSCKVIFGMDPIKRWK